MLLLLGSVSVLLIGWPEKPSQSTSFFVRLDGDSSSGVSFIIYVASNESSSMLMKNIYVLKVIKIFGMFSKMLLFNCRECG